MELILQHIITVMLPDHMTTVQYVPLILNLKSKNGFVVKKMPMDTVTIALWTIQKNIKHILTVISQKSQNNSPPYVTVSCVSAQNNVKLLPHCSAHGKIY